MARDKNSGRFTKRPSQQQREHQRQQQPRAWTTQRNDGSCARSTSIGAALALVGGVAAGAAVMYLLDPEAGEKRRRAVREAAAQAIDATGDTLGSTWETLSDSARAAAATASDKAHHLAESVGEAMPEMPSSRRWFGGGNWLSSARSMLPSMPSQKSLRRSARYYLPKDEGYGATCVAATAASSLALGLGAMWLFDPERGRGRRAWIGQKTTRFVNETGDFMRRTGRHLANKTRGYAHETRKAAGNLGQNISSSRLGELGADLAERVRFALGEIGIGSGSVAVSCEGGCVTLTGRCASSDADNIIETTRNVYGVDSVRNNMEVNTAAGI